VYVCKHLLAERARIAIWDPKVEAAQIRSDFDEYHALPPEEKFESLVTVMSDAYSAADGAHAIAVMTEWDEFANYDYARMYATMAKPAFIFDGRNVLNHAKLRAIGFEVYAIGKPFGQHINMD
jgi:UDPglucose 6-dehydrogenase